MMASEAGLMMMMTVARVMMTLQAGAAVGPTNQAPAGSVCSTASR